MSDKRSFLQGVEIDEAAARLLALEYFGRFEHRAVLIGQVSLFIGKGYGLNETEQLLESMVAEGVIRHATKKELSAFGYRHGYMLTTAGVDIVSGRSRT